MFAPHKYKLRKGVKQTKFVQRSYINRAIHDLYMQNKIIIPTFELENEINSHNS